MHSTHDNCCHAIKAILLLALFSIATALVGCGTFLSSSTQATRTAQAIRAQEQATQMALNLLATDAKRTATALTQLERTQQAMYDLAATALAKDQQTTAQIITRAAQATATEQAWGLFVETARNWPLVFAQTFEEDAGIWQTGQESNQFAKLSWGIVEGRYRWQAQARSGFTWWMIPEMQAVDDFYLSVELLPIDGPPDSERGLVLHYTDEESFYALVFDAQEHFSFLLYENGDWNSILPGIQSSAVRVGEANRVEIITEGPAFHIIINGDYLYSISYNHIYRGKIGLLAGLANAGDQATWEFDNLELRAAPAATSHNTP